MVAFGGFELLLIGIAFLFFGLFIYVIVKLASKKKD